LLPFLNNVEKDSENKAQIIWAKGYQLPKVTTVTMPQIMKSLGYECHRKNVTSTILIIKIIDTILTLTTL